MKTKRYAIIVTAGYVMNDESSTRLLNSYLDDGWDVQSATPFAQLDNKTEQKMLVVLKKEAKD